MQGPAPNLKKSLEVSQRTSVALKKSNRSSTPRVFSCRIFPLSRINCHMPAALLKKQHRAKGCFPYRQVLEVIRKPHAFNIFSICEIPPGFIHGPGPVVQRLETPGPDSRMLLTCRNSFAAERLPQGDARLRRPERFSFRRSPQVIEFCILFMRSISERRQRSTAGGRPFPGGAGALLRVLRLERIGAASPAAEAAGVPGQKKTDDDDEPSRSSFLSFQTV
jgi:hypothetical protein